MPNKVKMLRCSVGSLRIAMKETEHMNLIPLSSVNVNEGSLNTYKTVMSYRMPPSNLNLSFKKGANKFNICKILCVGHQ